MPLSGTMAGVNGDLSLQLFHFDQNQGAQDGGLGWAAALSERSASLDTHPLSVLGALPARGSPAAGACRVAFSRRAHSCPLA